MRSVLRQVLFWFAAAVGVVIAMMIASPQAFAQNYSTRTQAYAACQSYKDANASGYPVHKTNCLAVPNPSNGVLPHYLHERCREWNPTCEGGEGDFRQFTWPYEWQCPNGEEWNADTGQCEPPSCDGGAVRMTNGMCSPRPEQCSARNAEPGFIGVGDTTRNFTSTCIGGCQFGVAGPNTKTSYGGKEMVTGTFEFSGAVCGQSPTQPPRPDEDVKPAKPQECTEAGNQTFCVKASGEHCASTSGDRQICWRPGETGEKTDGKTLQKRNPGDTPQPPQTPPPSGDQWLPPTPPITTTSTFTDSKGQTTTITTTITNRDTGSGVDAGGKNQGQKGDGTGDAEGEEGGTEKGVHSRDCAREPTCSSADGIGCAILRQQWSNKCDALAGDVNQIGNTSELPVDGLEDSLIDVWDQGDGYIPGPTDVDTSGWAGRGSCPINLSFSIKGRSYEVDSPQLCEILDALAALIMIVGSWHAGFILTTGFRKG